MNVVGFLLSNGSDAKVLVTIAPSSLGLFGQPAVSEQIDGIWVDMTRVPHRTWADRTGAVGVVLTYLQGLSTIAAGFSSQAREYVNK